MIRSINLVVGPSVRFAVGTASKNVHKQGGVIFDGLLPGAPCLQQTHQPLQN